MARRSNSTGFSVAVDGVAETKRALRIMEATDAPYIREALTETSRLLIASARRRTIPSISSTSKFLGVKGTVGGLRAVVTWMSPKTNTFEFGRKWYRRGFTVDRRRATRTTTFRTKGGQVSSRIKQGMVNSTKGEKFRVARGFKPQPFLGVIKGGGALAEVEPHAKRLLTDAFIAEFERVANTKIGDD